MCRNSHKISKLFVVVVCLLGLRGAPTSKVILRPYQNCLYLTSPAGVSALTGPPSVFCVPIGCHRRVRASDSDRRHSSGVSAPPAGGAAERLGPRPLARLRHPRPAPPGRAGRHGRRESRERAHCQRSRHQAQRSVEADYTATAAGGDSVSLGETGAGFTQHLPVNIASANSFCGRYGLT